LKLDKGRGNYDNTHAVAVSWLWTQNHKFSQRLAKRLVEDWSIGAFDSIQSGAPLNFVMGPDVALNGSGQQNLQHAQLAAGKTYVDIGLDHPDRNAYVNQFFNTAAFVPIAQLPKGIYGNTGRNILNGPALNNTDFTLMKDLVVREPLRIQLRGEFFNAFNQVHFDRSEYDGSLGKFRPHP
jgi:hypothetical protein